MPVRRLRLPVGREEDRVRNPIITDTGVWDIKTWAYAEHDNADLPTLTALRTQTGLADFARRACDAAKALRDSAEQAGYVLLEEPQFHVFSESLIERNRPRLACDARVISREAGITELPQRRG